MQYILSEKEYNSLKENKELKQYKELISKMFDVMEQNQIDEIREKLKYPYQDLYDREYEKFFYHIKE